ncbi:MAG: hypothetical protein AAF443_00870 [Chlamydiota bacterium]
MIGKEVFKFKIDDFLRLFAKIACRRKVKTQVVSDDGSDKFYVFLPVWGLNFQHT